MKKDYLKKISIIILFFIGSMIFTYPFYSNGINYLIDQHRLKELNRSEEEAKLLKDSMKETNKSIKVNGLTITHDPFDINEIINNEPLDIKENLIGSISIPKINEKIPLFDTLNNQILENGAGVLQGSSMPTGGKDTHSVISAHRGLAERRLFRHLDQLEKKDVFLIDNLGEQLAYEVIDIQTVEPEGTDFIKLQPGEDLVSLLTCTPYMINSHRLIVTGKRIDITSDITNSIKKSVQKKKRKELIILLAIISLFLVILITLIKVIRNHFVNSQRTELSHVVLKNNKPVINQEFILLKKNQNTFKKNKHLVNLKSDETGEILLKNLKSGTYYLMLKKSKNKKKWKIIIK